jgi:adenosylmethionine-8-amino-7-oxononanoate aminotransferase
MAGKIDELLKNEKWRKKDSSKVKPDLEEIAKKNREQAEREAEEEERKRLERIKNSYHGVNMEAFKTPAMETHYDFQNNRLGNAIPRPWADRQYRQGGNANPRRRRREHPSGYHSCG